MTSRKRAKLLRDREEGMARVRRRLNNGQLTVDRTKIDLYEDEWEETLRPPRPIYVTPPQETKPLAAGTFVNNSPTAAQRKRGLPHSPWRAVGSLVWIRWEPQALETESWRFIDAKGETVKVTLL
ncbi:MAG: hypothetical protein M1840_005044 [Geoglossum simile]|nr:MAG: hypothetical protein M1840_005044 [Geoglossum simile]